jgi:hypothetical protein
VILFARALRSVHPCGAFVGIVCTFPFCFFKPGYFHQGALPW